MKVKQSYLTPITLGLFLGWIMSLPYEGPVLYAIGDILGFNGMYLNNFTVFAHFLGIISTAFFVKNPHSAKKVMLFSNIVCLIGSLVLIITPVNYWRFIIVPLAYIAGTYVTSWAFFYKQNADTKNRGKVSADVLIYSNIILTLSSFFSIIVAPFLGYSFIILILVLCIFVTSKLKPLNITNDSKVGTDSKHLKTTIIKPLFIFYLFIFMVTLTSGTMFQVVYPYYSDFELLSSLYTNIPYIIGLLFMRTLAYKKSKAYTLYMGMFFLGISYIEFFLLPKTIIGFFLVMTPLLFAYGIFDYFWWRIMGDLFEYVKNPACILGVGLGLNVFGVWCGGLIGQVIMAKTLGEHILVASFSIGILFTLFLLLPILNYHMSTLLKNHNFFIFFTSLSHPKQETVLESNNISDNLTEREKEIIEGVLKGYTYKKIASDLYISENTIKTHTKNIYRKLNISSKYQLIQLFNNITETKTLDQKNKEFIN
ncbi:LuxR family transcriptional regulator [Anaerovorax odorimutans]|uniref:LuxR family transcriptional regulator n=1 Tax=Anaerovorax odorimutans TaxID=109327 RepID=UPI000487DD65|nr:LuxR family transcriptional regulator [Anaerovorax odorimutans]